MGSKRIFSLPTFVTVVGLWTALSSGRPAPPPLPAELYTLNDSYPNYHLGPVSESRSGVWVNVVTATPLSCAWLINGSQPHQPFVAYQNSSSILLQPFDQNFRNTNITCINLKNSTERYNFTIGDVYGKFIRSYQVACIIVAICQSVHYLCVHYSTWWYPVQLHVHVRDYEHMHMYMYMCVHIDCGCGHSHCSLMKSHIFFWITCLVTWVQNLSPLTL